MSLVGPDQISSAQKKKKKRLSKAYGHGGCNVAVRGVQGKEGSRGGMQPGRHSASTCSPRPTGKIVEKPANVKEAFLSRYPEARQSSKPCSGATTAAPDTRCHRRGGSPGPTAERVPLASQGIAERGKGDAQAGKFSMHCWRAWDGATHLQNRGPCSTLGSVRDKGWGLIFAHHTRSPAASLENRYRAYSLDGSIIPEKQESSSSVGG